MASFITAFSAASTGSVTGSIRSTTTIVNPRSADGLFREKQPRWIRVGTSSSSSSSSSSNNNNNNNNNKGKVAVKAMGGAAKFKSEGDNDSSISVSIPQKSEGDNASSISVSQNFKHLWVQCEHCYGLNYKEHFKAKLNICEECGSHLKMSSPDRIDFLTDPGTWEPMDQDMISLVADPIGFHSEEDPYIDRLASYQRETGLKEAVQTGAGHINGIPVAIGVMDFQFMGGSMGSVVGEKITRLIEYATMESLPLIIVCASGGARMQEGSLSLMQMAKISAALYEYQENKKLFYVALLTSPTTGGVTASFGMLGDIIIAEPDAYIAFAGKRVIEQTLNIEVPEGLQSAEYLFEKGLFDLIVPRTIQKSVLSELLDLHGFLPLNQHDLASKE